MIGKQKEQHGQLGLDSPTVNLDLLSEDELLLLRSEIDSRLPVTKLADMNLERELTLQLRVAQALQRAIMDDLHTPANQKAQVLNSVSSSLSHLLKVQAEHYTPERLKKIERILVVTLNAWPKEQTETFFQQYELMLEDES